MCGMYIRVNKNNPHYVYIDICETGMDDPRNLNLKYYNNELFNQGLFFDVDCSRHIENEDNLDEWKNVPLVNKHFKCGNVSNEYCQTYVVFILVLIIFQYFKFSILKLLFFQIQTVGLAQNIKVKIDLYCSYEELSDPLPTISISPSLKSQEISAGACGIWSNKDMHECNFIDKENNDTCIAYSQTKRILEEWR